ncbi:hypothetical protein MY1884_008795 [Beauveria asiatica]
MPTSIQSKTYGRQPPNRPMATLVSLESSKSAVRLPRTPQQKENIREPSKAIGFSQVDFTTGEAKGNCFIRTAAYEATKDARAS